MEKFNIKFLNHTNLQNFEGLKVHEIHEWMNEKGGILLEHFIKTESSDLEKYLISLDLILAVEYLHYFQLAHRNIKISNVYIMKNKQSKLVLNSDTVKKIIIQDKVNRRKSIVEDNDPATTKYDLWSLGVLINSLFSKNDVPPNKKYLITPILYHEYPFSVSKLITNRKLTELLIKMTSKNEEYSIKDAKADLFELFFNETKQQKENLMKTFEIKDVSNYDVANNTNLTIYESKNDQKVNLLVYKVKKYLILYKSLFSRRLERLKDFVSKNSHSLQNMYLKNYSGPNINFTKKVGRRISRQFTEKMRVEDFYEIKLTKDAVRKFVKRIKVNEIQSDRIQFVKNDPDYRLGEGGFSKVRKAKLDDRCIAVKILSNFNMEEFIKELNILKKFYHTYIPTVYGIFQKQVDEEKITLNIAMELIKGKTLDIIMKFGKLLELEKIIILLDLALVLQYIHEFNLVHRDLKPANIMINEKLDVKLIDFGISRSAYGSFQTARKGTCLYMAPENYTEEIIEEEDNSDHSCLNISDTSENLTDYSEDLKPIVTNKVDVWAYGLIANEMLTGDKPWANLGKNACDAKITSQLMSKNEYKIKNIENLIMKRILENCTKVNPEERCDMKKAKEDMLELLYNQVKSVADLKSYYLQNYKDTRNVDRRFLYFLTKINNYLLLFHSFYAEKNKKTITVNEKRIFQTSNLARDKPNPDDKQEDNNILPLKKHSLGELKITIKGNNMNNNALSTYFNVISPNTIFVDNNNKNNLPILRSNSSNSSVISDNFGLTSRTSSNRNSKVYNNTNNEDPNNVFLKKSNNTLIKGNNFIKEKESYLENRIEKEKNTLMISNSSQASHFHNIKEHYNMLKIKSNHTSFIINKATSETNTNNNNFNNKDQAVNNSPLIRTKKTSSTSSKIDMINTKSHFFANNTNNMDSFSKSKKVIFI